MNCKKDDLAIVISCPAYPSAIGVIVECINYVGKYLINGEFYSDVWVVKWGDKQAFGYEGFGMCDSWMRPIRDSGDDALSEDLRPLPEVVGDTGAFTV